MITEEDFDYLLECEVKIDKLVKLNLDQNQYNKLIDSITSVDRFNQLLECNLSVESLSRIMIFSCNLERYDVTKRAIELGAYVNATYTSNVFDGPAITYCGKNNEMIKYFLDKGADPYVEDSDKRTIFHYALSLDELRDCIDIDRINNFEVNVVDFICEKIHDCPYLDDRYYDIYDEWAKAGINMTQPKPVKPNDHGDLQLK